MKEPMIEIRTERLELGEQSGEFGQQYKVICSTCGDNLSWWEHYNPSRANVCQCGIEWEAVIHAVGVRP
jgi:hypothetical protein